LGQHDDSLFPTDFQWEMYTAKDPEKRVMPIADLDAWRVARAAADALSLKLYSPSSPASALTAIAPPLGLDSGEIVKRFRNRFGAVVANGQGEMKGQVFRIAHLGYYDYMDTIGVIAALEQVMSELQADKVEFGVGVRAAQEVFAAAQKQKATAQR
jgi:aspartate aminotransferase-like enzyme